MPTETLLMHVIHTLLMQNTSVVSRMRLQSPDSTQAKYYLNYWKMVLSPWPIINPQSYLLHSGTTLTRRAKKAPVGSLVIRRILYKRTVIVGSNLMKTAV